LKLHKTKRQSTTTQEERERGALAAWTSAASVGDYLKRLNLQATQHQSAAITGSSSYATTATAGGGGGWTSTTTSSTPIHPPLPFNPVMDEVQCYLQAARISYGIIMRLKDEGKIYYAALKHLM